MGFSHCIVRPERWSRSVSEAWGCRLLRFGSVILNYLVENNSDPRIS